MSTQAPLGRRLLREPLLHFLALGALLFALFQIVGEDDEAAEARRIVVDEGMVEHLAETFALTWQRPPTPEELRELVEDRVREEILAREAVALGLAEDDTVVRRRLRQKMELLAESTSEVEPAEEVLAAYFEKHRSQYLLPAQVAFRQVYFSPDRRGEPVAADAREALARLAAGASPDELGDAILLPDGMPDAPLTEVARSFGEDFAAALEALPRGEWAGPVESGFGVHLVRVDGWTDARIPALEEVRAAVLRDWQSQQARSAKDAFYQALRDRYEVVLDLPEAVGAGGGSGASER